MKKVQGYISDVRVTKGAAVYRRPWWVRVLLFLVDVLACGSMVAMLLATVLIFAVVFITFGIQLAWLLA